MQVLDRVSTVLKQKGMDVWSVSPDATVHDALELLADKGIGALLVIKDGKLLGVFSERDYARKIALKGRSSQHTKVSEAMNAPAISISLDGSVDEAMRTMTEWRVRHLPVVDGDGKVVGMLSIGDLVKWIITSHERTIAQLHGYITGQYDTTVGHQLLPTSSYRAAQAG